MESVVNNVGKGGEQICFFHTYFSGQIFYTKFCFRNTRTFAEGFTLVFHKMDKTFINHRFSP